MGKIHYTKYHGGAYGAQVTPSAMYHGREAMRKALYLAETRMLIAIQNRNRKIETRLAFQSMLREAGRAQRTAQHVAHYAEIHYIEICRGLFQ